MDSLNSDVFTLEYCLGPSRRVLFTADPETPRALAALLASPGVRTFWFLRSPHDVSGRNLNRQLERQIGPGMAVTVHPYGRFSPLEMRLMRVLGMTERPDWFQELLEFRR